VRAERSQGESEDDVWVGQLLSSGSGLRYNSLRTNSRAPAEVRRWLESDGVPDLTHLAVRRPATKMGRGSAGVARKAQPRTNLKAAARF
jgi:hypothetical protein